MLILREPHKNLAITRGAEGWREFLAHPPRHWKDNDSARRLAQAWEASDPEAPPELARAFAGTPFARFVPVIAIPAYEVDMPGGWIGAMNDLLVLGTIDGEVAVLMVQGKVTDHMGPTVDEWLYSPSPGRLRRLGYLTEQLGLPGPIPETMCCQLLHRAASPLVEAKRLKARYAGMAVVAFGVGATCRDEYQAFARVLGAEGGVGRLERLPGHDDPELWIGWVEAEPAD